VQIRGQNLTDARARESNAITQAGNQDKPLNDSQSKAALFGSRMKMLTLFLVSWQTLV